MAHLCKRSNSLLLPILAFVFANLRDVLSILKGP
jgi:hypothetical protein